MTWKSFQNFHEGGTSRLGYDTIFFLSVGHDTITGNLTKLASEYLAVNLCNMTSKPHLGEKLFGAQKIQWTMIAKKACSRNM